MTEQPDPRKLAWRLRNLALHLEDENTTFGGRVSAEDCREAANYISKTLETRAKLRESLAWLTEEV
jgi:hypothetical protein